MNTNLIRIAILLLIAVSPLSDLVSGAENATLTLTSPQDFQVFQRSTKDTGAITVAGHLDGMKAESASIEVRLSAEGKPAEWRKLPATFKDLSFASTSDAPAGGWYHLDVRVTSGEFVGVKTIEHVGVGEVFVIAGQSNSANHGAEQQMSTSGKVATFTGKIWQLSNDPQPGASGGGGSFMPPFGDAMVQRFNVPVGIIACGIGATSVREWLPKGSVFPNPPTLTGNVVKRPDGQWESKGQIFETFIARMKQLGSHGFRAVLWHQGESDANQADASRTLSGKLYRDSLEKIIRESRKEIGWDAPWFVAQASYHVPGDEASPDIRTAQESLWKDGIANAGPDSDSLKSEFREANGKGVHFSGLGLRKHAALWVDKVAPWLEEKLK